MNLSTGRPILPGQGASGQNGGGSNGNGPGLSRMIVVDIRELRCSLPSLLHIAGASLVTRSITVGDYVLSPEICVERKAIGDLFSSFQSGRLYVHVNGLQWFV